MAAAAPVETGTHHGVYVSRDGHNIAAYLHKPSVEVLKAWDAIAEDEIVSIDTGMVWLDMPTVQKLVALAGEDAVAALSRLVAPHGNVLVICHGADQPAGLDQGPPWPLTERELVGATAQAGMAPQAAVCCFSDDQGVARIRAVFKRA